MEIKNRPKGMLVWKNRTVTKDVYRELLISQLIPAILEKWLRRDRMSTTIYIQQDGAKNHIREDDEEFNNALMEQDIDAKLYMQTPNSPDMNLLDLGFFRAIQSFNDALPKNEEELIQSVMEAYENYPPTQAELHVANRFNQIILHHEDNNYSIEHILKAKLEWQGQLPNVLDVVDDIIYQMNDESDGESNSYNKNDSLNKNNESNSSTTPKINEYPSYPHTSGRIGAMANDSPHRNRFFLLIVASVFCVCELEGVWGLVVVFCSYVCKVLRKFRFYIHLNKIRE